MPQRITVFGYGAVGRPIVERLVERGDTVLVATRHRPSNLPGGAEHLVCDVLNMADVARALVDADQAVLAVGFPYDARIWRVAWPKAMACIVAACAEGGARLVFIDNLYQLGPQTTPRTEKMELAPTGEKPTILAEVTRIWQQANGGARVAALRCTDFYGPGVEVSHLGTSAFGRLAAGKSAQLLVPPDELHDFAYVPDIARAAVILLDAPDDDFGQAWNMPCAPTQTTRDLLSLGAAAIGSRLRLMAIPFGALRVLGLVYPFAREVADVGFTWDRPYVVDGSKFAGRFEFAPTPFTIGIPATIWSFKGDRSGG